ncbi:hypothetical protein [Methylobacterium bullatum]|uniref:hypothetical protein n=1 Tax=Methylobacterium bullatum TaxID=570505 RepID=UPI0030D32CA4
MKKLLLFIFSSTVMLYVELLLVVGLSAVPQVKVIAALIAGLYLVSSIILLPALLFLLIAESNVRKYSFVVYCVWGALLAGLSAAIMVTFVPESYDIEGARQASFIPFLKLLALFFMPGAAGGAAVYLFIRKTTEYH